MAYPVIISNPIISGSHSMASFSPLFDPSSVNADAVAAGDDDDTGFSVLVTATDADGSSFLTNCWASPVLACAILSLIGESAAFVIGESILDFRRMPFVSALDNKTIRSKFIAFGNILLLVSFYLLFEKRLFPSENACQSAIEEEKEKHESSKNNEVRKICNANRQNDS